MELSVKLLSMFSKHADRLDAAIADTKEGDTVLDLARAIGLPEKYLRIVTVNGKQVDLDHKLHEGDTVFFVPPAMGGG